MNILGKDVHNKFSFIVVVTECPNGRAVLIAWTLSL
jgi:hypothetical protein